MEMNLRPYPKQHLTYEALRNPDIDTVFFGGASGGGKSWVICESRLVNCLRFPGYKSFIGREELKRLMGSTFITWSKVCQHHKIPQDLWSLNGQYSYIEFRNGSRIDLLDLKSLPSDPLFERFGSLEYTDGAIEEAGEIDFLAYDVLRSRLGRHKNKDFGLHPVMLVTGNPKKNWTYSEFYKPWKEGKLATNIAFIQAFYTDNHEMAEAYGKVLDRIKDKQTKERLMFGNWEYEDDPACLLSFDAISDLFTNTVRHGVDRYLTGDIARFGKDKTVLCLWEGLKVSKVYVYRGASIDRTISNIKLIAAEEFVPYSNIIVDEDGVGGGVMDGLRGIVGFVANARPLPSLERDEIENFVNLKAQCTYKLADLVNGHGIAVDSNVVKDEHREDDGAITNEIFREFLTEELGFIRSKDADKDGKRKIMPKEEIKERLGRSPDFADALMMRMYFELDGSARASSLRRGDSMTSPALMQNRGGIIR